MPTIRKRGGRWQVQVRRQGHEPATATLDTKGAAQRWARRVEAEMDQGKASGQPRVTGTVGDLLARYEVEARKVRELRRSALDVLAKLNAGLGSVPLRRLTAEAVLEHARRRRQGGAGPVTVGVWSCRGSGPPYGLPRRSQASA